MDIYGVFSTYCDSIIFFGLKNIDCTEFLIGLDLCMYYDFYKSLTGDIFLFPKKWVTVLRFYLFLIPIRQDDIEIISSQDVDF